MDLNVELIPKYSCVLTELAIYNTGFETYSNFACIVDNLVGLLEECLSLSNVNASWPWRLNGSKVYKLTLGFGTFVSINAELWDMWGMYVHELTLGGEQTSSVIDIWFTHSNAQQMMMKKKFYCLHTLSISACYDSKWIWPPDPSLGHYRFYEPGSNWRKLYLNLSSMKTWH